MSTIQERSFSPQKKADREKLSLISYEEDKFKEKCAVAGVFSRSQPAVSFVYQGLSSQQHRGQEASGIATTDGMNILSHKGHGLVSQGHTEEDLMSLSGNIGIGHTRYSTSRGREHLQPVTSEVGLVALSHNGTLPETKVLEQFLTLHNIDPTPLNDSEMMQRAIEYYVSKGLPLDEATKSAYPLFTGAFALVVMTKDTLIGVRDSHGIRPLSIGILPNDEGYLLSSETCGIEEKGMGGKVLRDVKAGEMIVINNEGIRSQQIVEGEEKLDIFEIVYFARPDSKLYGKSVNEMRMEMGRTLAREKKIDADMVIAVPNSAIPAAAGYAEESGIPYIPNALMKDSYTHRTFIDPSADARADGVRRKFIPIKEMLKGKRVILVDDSIVRGTTTEILVQILRDAGAAEVNLVISSPPVKFPDYYGIATPVQKDLIASQMTIDDTRKKVGADSLQYLSFDGMITSTGFPKERFNTSCFTGEYPIDIGDNAKTIDFTV